MKHALLRCFAFALLVTVSLRANTDTRFSLTLNADDRTSSGLVRLSSDEVAVVDALVRRDTTSRGAVTTSGDNVSAIFSERLTADERRTAGLQKLPAAELTKLNAFVERFQAAKLARTLLAPPVYLARSTRVNPTETKKEREIHGSFSLSYGWGKGGYSEKTGSMMLTMDDPERRFSITVGYTESHIKGGPVYRDPYYDRYDPFYDPLRRVPEGPLITRP